MKFKLFEFITNCVAPKTKTIENDKFKKIVRKMSENFEVPSVSKNGGGLEALGNYNKAIIEKGSYFSKDGLKTIDSFTGKVHAEDRDLGDKFVSKLYNKDGTYSIKVTKNNPPKPYATAAKTSASAADNAERLLKIDGALKSDLLKAMDTPDFKLDKNSVKKLIDEYPEPIEKLAKCTDSKNKQMFSAAEIVTLLGNEPTLITKRADEVFEKLKNPSTLKYLESFEKNRSYVLCRLIMG